MGYLLDTHTLLWFLNASEQLPDHIKNIIIDGKNECFVSIASLWEISIELNLGKLFLGIQIAELESWLVANNLQILPINFNHIFQNPYLPFHHRDPFDRIIITQAIFENLIVLSKDTNFKMYEVNTLW